MFFRRRLLVSLGASLLLVLAQLVVADHVHEYSEPSSVCAYCISSDSSNAIVSETRTDVPVFIVGTDQPAVLVVRSTEVRHSYASRAPPSISS